MIRFKDIEVESIELGTYNKKRMLKHLKINAENKFALIFDKDQYYGFSTYESIAKCHGDNGIIRKKYVLHNGNDLFMDLNQLFDDKENIAYIPVFNTDMRLVCWAYQYSDTMVELVEKAFYFLEKKHYLFLENIEPYIKKIFIYDFNEFAFRLYNALEKRCLLVEVDGKRWNDLYSERYVHSEIKSNDISPESVFYVYAEGKEGERCGWSWRFMYAVMKVNLFYKMDEWKNYLLGKNIAAYTMIFPDFSELDYYTKDEAYRNKMGIRNEATIIDIKDPQIVQQIEKCWKDGSKGKFNEAVTVEKRRRSEQWVLGEKSVACKKYGGEEYTIYLIGPCIVAGYFVDEEDCLGAYLYRLIRQNWADYSVVCIAVADDDITTYESIMQSLTLYENDFVIMIDFHVYFKNDIGKNLGIYTGNVDVKSILNCRKQDWFWDIPIHTNQRGNREISQILVNDYLLRHIKGNPKKCECKLILPGKCFLDKKAENYIENYIAEIKEVGVKDTNIGCIVMNCNPMTNGHLHLIQSALQYVEFIYIFLVEEDRSEISFEIRYEILKSVVKKYPNVKVVPSGRFVLSYETMPIYFKKAEKQEEILDATKDLKIFGEKIAPRLEICTRFVGEEPQDKITEQYNKAMKKILPAYGINVIEVPRLKYQGQIISASTVRNYIKEKEIDVLSQLVPEEAFGILKNVIEQSVE